MTDMSNITDACARIAMVACGIGLVPFFLIVGFETEHPAMIALGIAGAIASIAMCVAGVAKMDAGNPRGRDDT